MSEMFEVIEPVYDKKNKVVDFIYREVNPAFERFLGKTREELIGKHAKDFLKIEDYWLDLYGKVAKVGKPVHYENYGGEFGKYYDVHAWKLKENQIALIISDITERKRAEALLKSSEEKFRNLAEQSPSLILITQNERIIYINDAAEKLSGYKKEEICSPEFSFMDMIPPESIEMVEFSPQYMNGEGDIEFEHKLITKKGQIIDLITHAKKIYYNGESAILSVSTDITESKQLRKKLEKYSKHLEDLVKERTAQLEQAQSQLIKSERLAAIGATAGMVGHDIRNPLQAIVGDVYLTKSETIELPESKIKLNIQENLEAIEKNVDYINKIVLDLQDFARPITPVIKEVNMKSLIVDSLQSEKVPKNIKTFYNVDENVTTIFTDEDLLKRILNNLGLNAVQAMPNGGKIFVTVFRNNEDTIVTVEDTGVGIPDEIKPKLFTPMVTTKAKGQGFGLAAAKRMTEALGGTISFESKVGKGTKFTIRLPPLKQ